MTGIVERKNESARNCKQVQFLLDFPLTFVPALDYEQLEEEPIALHELAENTRLDPQHEAHLFRQMNLAFANAARVREQIEDDRASSQLLAQLEYHIDRGIAIRNHLLLVFHKLAVALARAFVGPRFDWDELKSEAHNTLLYAIGKFNPDRGFRFSTYATHAVRRQLARYVRRQRLQGGVSVDWQSSRLPDHRRWSYSYQRQIERSMKEVESLMGQLSPRERYVLRSRFGWGREFEPRTLQQIADEFDISRERVRQIESRAIEKLQHSIKQCPRR